MIRDLMNLPSILQRNIDFHNENIQNIVQSFHYNNLFILGKGILYPIAQEGSLKIKEISYIHSEAYSSSALKHGPFSLLDENFPVIILDQNDDNHSKNMNTLEEVYSRNSPIFLITNSKDYPSNKNFHVIHLPTNKSYQSILFISILQLFAYYLSIKKGIECDKPRNLAKTVTTL